MCINNTRSCCVSRTRARSQLCERLCGHERAVDLLRDVAGAAAPQVRACALRLPVRARGQGVVLVSQSCSNAAANALPAAWLGAAGGALHPMLCMPLLSPSCTHPLPKQDAALAGGASPEAAGDAGRAAYDRAALECCVRHAQDAAQPGTDTLTDLLTTTLTDPLRASQSLPRDLALLLPNVLAASPSMGAAGSAAALMGTLGSPLAATQHIRSLGGLLGSPSPSPSSLQASHVFNTSLARASAALEPNPLSPTGGGGGSSFLTTPHPELSTTGRLFGSLPSQLQRERVGTPPLPQPHVVHKAGRVSLDGRASESGAGQLPPQPHHPDFHQHLAAAAQYPEIQTAGYAPGGGYGFSTGSGLNGTGRGPGGSAGGAAAGGARGGEAWEGLGAGGYAGSGLQPDTFHAIMALSPQQISCMVVRPEVGGGGNHMGDAHVRHVSVRVWIPGISNLALCRHMLEGSCIGVLFAARDITSLLCGLLASPSLLASPTVPRQLCWWVM